MTSKGKYSSRHKEFTDVYHCNIKCNFVKENCSPSESYGLCEYVLGAQESLMINEWSDNNEMIEYIIKTIHILCISWLSKEKEMIKDFMNRV